MVSYTSPITEDAYRRYHMDPEFHARVMLAVRTLEHENGVQLDSHDRSLALKAAAIALLDFERGQW